MALGKPEELGTEAHLGGTVIRFGLPAGVGPDRVPAGDLEVEVSGNRLALRTGDPQGALYRVHSWAQAEGIALEGLDVRRPSLEDILSGADRGPGRRGWVTSGSS